MMDEWHVLILKKKRDKLLCELHDRAYRDIDSCRLVEWEFVPEIENEPCISVWMSRVLLYIAVDHHTQNLFCDVICLGFKLRDKLSIGKVLTGVDLRILLIHVNENLFLRSSVAGISYMKGVGDQE